MYKKPDKIRGVTAGLGRTKGLSFTGPKDEMSPEAAKRKALQNIMQQPNPLQQMVPQNVRPGAPLPGRMTEEQRKRLGE